MSDISRPVPARNADTEHYWEAASDERLLYKQCGECGHVLGYPRGQCPSCQTTELTWRASLGRGRIVSYTIVHRAPTPAFRDDCPYVIALVDFDEGFRLMANVCGDDALETTIGDAVEVQFESRGEDGAKIPQVRRLSQRANK